MAVEFWSNMWGDLCCIGGSIWVVWCCLMVFGRCLVVFSWCVVVRARKARLTSGWGQQAAGGGRRSIDQVSAGEPRCLPASMPASMPAHTSLTLQNSPPATISELSIHKFFALATIQILPIGSTSGISFIPAFRWRAEGAHLLAHLACFTDEWIHSSSWIWDCSLYQRRFEEGIRGATMDGQDRRSMF